MNALKPLDSQQLEDRKFSEFTLILSLNCKRTPVLTKAAREPRAKVAVSCNRWGKQREAVNIPDWKLAEAELGARTAVEQRTPAW